MSCDKVLIGQHTAVGAQSERFGNDCPYVGIGKDPISVTVVMIRLDMTKELGGEILLIQGLGCRWNEVLMDGK